MRSSPQLWQVSAPETRLFEGEMENRVECLDAAQLHNWFRQQELVRVSGNVMPRSTTLPKGAKRLIPQNSRELSCETVRLLQVAKSKHLAAKVLRHPAEHKERKGNPPPDHRGTAVLVSVAYDFLTTYLPKGTAGKALQLPFCLSSLCWRSTPNV